MPVTSKGRTGKSPASPSPTTSAPASSVDAVMFSKTGAKDTPIPEDLMKKGTPVQVCGFFRPAKTKDGNKYSGFDLVVASCDPLEDESAT